MRNSILCCIIRYGTQSPIQEGMKEKSVSDISPEINFSQVLFYHRMICGLTTVKSPCFPCIIMIADINPCSQLQPFAINLWEQNTFCEGPRPRHSISQLACWSQTSSQRVEFIIYSALCLTGTSMVLFFNTRIQVSLDLGVLSNILFDKLYPDN